jgi:O-acetyl-ADP-ribose deacetylase (regulator of RNase III)
MVNYVKGNLLDSNCDYICHQVNCQGVMGSGIARQIRERFPIVYEAYLDRHHRYVELGVPTEKMLGSIDVILVSSFRGFVINMYSQNNCGYDGKRYTSYDAFVDALHEIKRNVPPGRVIGFPKNIGCGLGGGDWTVVSALIEAILGKDYDIYIYEWEGD